MPKQFFQSWTQNLGRNGWDQPLAIPDDMSAESVNIELREGGLGKKRAGTETVTASAGLTSISNLAKFVPSNDETLSELFFVAYNGATTALYRVPGAMTAEVALSTAVTRPVSFAQLNGKFFFTCSLGANRIRVYAPAESTTTTRYAGLAPSGVPTVANTGAGAYAAIVRYYRVTLRAKSGATVIRQSEPSASVSFTPSGAGTAARITKPASLPGAGETHWVIEASQNDATFWEIAEVAIGTATYDDSVSPTQYPSVGSVPPLVGSCFPFPNVKYLASDGTRLLGVGTYETAAGDSVPPVNGRLYFTPVLGSSDLGDDERIVDTTEYSGWIDVAVGGGGADRGLAGPINNAMIAFQTNGVYAFFPTGNAQSPYRRVVLTRHAGSISGSSVVMGEDESGQPALYFLDPKAGPYRVGSGYTMQWIGKDINDIWQTADLTSSDVEADFWGVYDSARKLVIWKIKTAAVSGVLSDAMGSPTSTTAILVFDVTNGRMTKENEIRKGWVLWTEPAEVVTSSGVMFPSTLATPRPLTQSLYYGNTGASGIIYRTLSTATQDGSASYKAYVRSKAYRWLPMGRLKKILEAIAVAKSRTATTIRHRLTSNWGERNLDQTVSIAPVGSSAYVRPRPSPVDMTDLATVQVELGDSAEANNTWELESWEAQVEELEQTR